MPLTPVLNTRTLVVFEIPSETGTLRVEIEGRKLFVDPDTGRIAFGTVSKIKTFEYSGDVSTGVGRSWDKIDLAAADLSVLLGTADWHIPQPGTPSYYDTFAALPTTSVLTIFSPTDNYVEGGSATDYLFGTELGDYMEGRGGNDRLIGGTGLDFLGGGEGDDRLFGGADEDALFGGTGNDRLAGEAGFNTLYGGEGNDKLSSGNDGSNQWGGAGNDVMLAGIGDDDLRGGDGNDYAAGGGGNDIIFGDADNDRLYGGADNDALNGGFGDDILDGGLGDDILEGAGGADVLNGSDGSDVLLGGGAADNMNGGAGNDVIYGETGNDTMMGGADLDQFIFDTASSGSKSIYAFNSIDDEVIFLQFEGDVASAYQYFLEHATNVGKNVVFTDGDLSITFTRTQLTAFSLENFGQTDGGDGGGGGGGEIIG